MRMCRVLTVSRIGYYKSLSRKSYTSEIKRNVIAFHAKVFHKRFKGIYGYRKVYENFKDKLSDLPCSREAIRKVMHENNLFDCIRRRHRYPAQDNLQAFEYPKNKLNRNYKTSAKNLKWPGDITYINTLNGWVYLGAVMDLFSRKVVGWSVSTNTCIHSLKECSQGAQSLRVFIVPQR